MSTGQPSPRVSILTPVYNGAEHLVECIESVLAQTYTNWDYTIVNNGSTDESLTIAQRYAAKDPRIRVVNTDRFLTIVENHNFTARQISPDSKYCKFVFADDWLYPQCVDEMVRLAERNPSVGLVSAYAMDGRSVHRDGPQYPTECLAGREACRNQLRGGPYVFGTMTMLLVRCDLIRKRANLFVARHLQADMEACFDLFQESDFGFIHQVLSFVRERDNATDALAVNLNSYYLGEFVIFLKYGRALLNDCEFEEHWERLRQRYYGVLAHNVLRFRSKEFWKYHQDALTAYGGRLDRWLLAKCVIADLANQVAHPWNAFRRSLHWWFPKERRGNNGQAREHRESKSAGTLSDTNSLKPE
jgi:glycosyltransferase involved in cell wall biosynthesis